MKTDEARAIPKSERQRITQEQWTRAQAEKPASRTVKPNARVYKQK